MKSKIGMSIFFLCIVTFLSAQDTVAAKIFYLEGRKNYDNKNYRDALILFEKAVISDKSNYVYYKYEGKTYQKLSDYVSALKSYDKAEKRLSFGKIDYDFSLYKGQCYYYLKQYQKSIEYYTVCLQKISNNPNIYYERGRSFYYIEKYEEVIKDCQASLALKGSANAWELLGKTYLKLKNYNGALDNLSQAIQLKNDESTFYYYRAKAYEGVSQWEKCLVDYNHAIILDSSDVDYYCNRGATFYYLGKYEKALNDYSKAISLDSKYFLAYFNRANLFYEMQNYKEALKDFDKALDVDKNCSNCLINKAYCLLELGDTTQATKFLNSYLKNNPTDFIALAKKIEIDNFSKKNAASIAKLSNKLISNSKDSIPKSWAYYAKAMTLQDKDTLSCIKYLDSAILYCPVYHFYYLARGLKKAEYYLGSSRYQKEVLSDFEKAESLLPDKGLVYLVRGYTYAMIYKEKIKGCDDFKKAKELGLKDVDPLLDKFCR